MKTVSAKIVRAACALLMGWACLLPTTKTHAQGEVVFAENFDGAFANDGIALCKQGGCDVPTNWGVWFIPRRDTDPAGVNFQPKFGSSSRARAGNAQRIFETNKTFTGGIYRKIENVRVGEKVRFTAWGMAWSTNDESPISARPSSGIRLKIGIDPLGGDNGKPLPLSSQVVWSAEQDTKDNFASFTVEVEAKATTILVYTFATMKDVVRHNEAFWDDAQVAYAQAAAMSASSTTTNTNPANTAEPPPPAQTGGTKHTVVAGDTLFGISLQYNVGVDEIKRLNSMQNDNLSIGQELIIVPPQAAPPPTETPIPPTPLPPAPGTAAVAQVPLSASGDVTQTGQVCMYAYFDDDGNGKRVETEDFVPNVRFTLSTGGTVVGETSSNGVDKQCFDKLPAIEYTVVASYTNTYIPTTPLDDRVRVREGAEASFLVGLRRPDAGFVDVSKTPVPADNPLTRPGNIFGALATIGGALLVVGALGIVISLVLRRRQL